MAEKNEKFEVEILDVREVVTYPRLGVQTVTHIVTYRSGDMPPRTLFIPEKEDTPENRARLIREDILKAKTRKPMKLTV